MLVASSFAAQAQITETATDAVKNMGVGWNLGNTLDAYIGSGTDATAATYWGQQGVNSETCWGQSETKPELFTMMKKAGFGAIRVPVTWFNHMDADGKVDPAWMKRVHEVVDYVIDNGLYCIINVHHDTGANGDNHASWIKANETVYTNTKARYEGLWKQIAEEFKDYDNKLLFGGYNEMLDTYNSWCYATYAASGQYNATDAKSAYNGLNGYAKSFVNSVRATGGNNSTRNLIINTYAATPGTGTWNTHLQEPLTNLNLPDDAAGKGHLIVEVHTYPAISKKSGNSTVSLSIGEIKNTVDDLVSTLKSKVMSKGAPVIIGEWGTSNVDSGAGETDYDKRPDLMKYFAEYFIKQTKAAGIGTFYWMGMSDGVCRSMPSFSQPDLAECLAKAYHGSSFVGEYPDMTSISQYVCFDGDKKIAWGDGISLPSSLFANMSPKTELIIEYKQEGGDDCIQFFYGDWSEKSAFIVGDNSFVGDLNPGSYYGTPDGTSHTTTVTFDATTFAKLQKKGLILHGNNIRLYKATLREPASAGIGSVTTTTTSGDTPAYNILGQRLNGTQKGINIIGGKKVVVR